MISKDPLLLMIPGPVSVHQRIYEALARPITGHRTKEFIEVFGETVNLLKKLLDTKNDVFIITGSSTSAMDAAIANLVSPGEKVLNVIQGKFSERWKDITEAYGGIPVVLNVEWGKALREQPLIDMLESDADIKYITICHNETSTGILNPAEKIGQIAKDYNKILIVDGVTSVGGDYVYPDRWNFDILVTGSQKCLGIPPGLGFIMVGPRAWEIINQRKFIPSYYLNLKSYKTSFEKDGDPPFTTSVPLIVAQNESLKMIFEEGFENRVKRHRRMAKATRIGAKALGLELFAEEEYASNTVTAIKMPPKIVQKDFLGNIQKLGVLLTGGQDKIKEKIFRIAHMNTVQEKDIFLTFSAIELTLQKLGFAFKPGSGVGAIEQFFAQNP
jgi:aspartate aminotransferase-like enzyme